MTRRTLPLIATALLLGTLLSGCFGYPEGAVRASDQLGILYTAKASGSNATLPGECFTGWPFEEVPAAVKQPLLGETVATGHALTATVPAGVACHRVHRVTDVVRVEPRISTIERSIVENAVGEVPVEGKEYTVNTQGGPFTFTVVRVNATMVDYAPALPPRASYPDLGFDIVPSFTGDDITYRIVANVTGAVFTGPLGTAVPLAGNLTVIGSIGSEILIAEETARPVLGASTLELSATVMYVQPAGSTPTDGGFGHRASNVVSPGTSTATSAPLAPMPHDDGDGHLH